MMKIYINFDFQNTLHSGGNSFLGSLGREFQSLGMLVSNPEDADVILLNSHHSADYAVSLKSRFPDKKYVLRIDGPMRKYGSIYDQRDWVVEFTKRYIADAVIYQSNWCKIENEKLYGAFNGRSTVIRNAPDPKYFYPETLVAKENIRIIATSWSTNPNKGASVLDWLDENLSFNNVLIKFYGRHQSHWKNIESYPAVGPEELGNLLRASDIYLFPSKFEACSNALLEGIFCGCVPLTYKGSSNVELVVDERFYFTSPEELKEKIYLYSKERNQFTARIKHLDSLNQVATRYTEFFRSLSSRKMQTRFLKFRKPLFLALKKADSVLSRLFG